jgi:alginate O-acetyltransferase complex protein AlgI
MLFNSAEFILAFLPVTFIVYFTLTHNGKVEFSRIWLVIASLFFYGWWNPNYLVLICISMLMNYGFAYTISKNTVERQRKLLLIAGIVFNVGLLGYYKYADFFIDNFNVLIGSDYNLLNIILPLGISFFTFQQIAFVVDTYRREIPQVDIVQYSLFVCFFPQLIAGPIVHHKEIMPQFMDREKLRINTDNIARGIFIFNMGLAKKIIIADTFGQIANLGYQNYQSLDTWQSWITAFAYSVQLYFDFSGYSDMAIGIGLLFNITLPVNFRSPHKSANIQQFYRRWHITLSNFLRDYIYIPLGGNKKGEFVTNLNLFLTFLIGGFWHGANWTFVIWGALNGIALIAHRMFQKTGVVIPQMVAVTITFLFVMFVRVFFRSENFSVASQILATMFGAGSGGAEFTLIASMYNAPIWIAGVILLFMPNSTEFGERFKHNSRFALMLVAMTMLNFTFMNSTIKQDFLYFDF